MTNVATRFQPDISGSAVPAGYIGEFYEDTVSTLFTTTAATIASRTLTPGVWRIYGQSSMYATDVVTTFRMGIYTTTAAPGITDTYSSTSNLQTTGYQTYGALNVERIVNISANTTYYIRGISAGANVNILQKTTIYWIRIA